ncbi:MAG: aldehyde dehydrogenase family protein [Bryobacteraceae bacterium]
MRCGFFLGPTVFDGIAPQMTIAREKVFGPVLESDPCEGSGRSHHPGREVPGYRQEILQTSNPYPCSQKQSVA